MRAFFLRCLAVLTACALASCIDGREEVWIEADGSGRADIAFSLPAAAAVLQGGEEGVREMIDGILKGASGLTSWSREVTVDGDRMHVRVKAAFSSVRDLMEISSGAAAENLPASATGMAGKVKLDIRGRTVDFAREISAGKALPGAIFMPASQFKDRRLVYIMHLPAVAKESNATRVENGGRTLVWDFPLSQAVRAPVVTRFVVDVPLPWWVWAGGGLLLAGIAWLGFRGIRRLRQPVSPCP